MKRRRILSAAAAVAVLCVLSACKPGEPAVKEPTEYLNGDIGKISDADRVNSRCIIDFDGRKAFYDGEMLKKIEHAYAVTVHKSQGSEYPAVIIPLPNRMDRISYRTLLYTAVTRAKKTLIIIGTENKIREMVDNNRKTVRCSCLKEMLEDYFD